MNSNDTERSTHSVDLQYKSVPCFCWATSNHRIGEEVLTKPTEREARLQEAREVVTAARERNGDPQPWWPSSASRIDDALITLDEEVARLHSGMTAVRELHSLHKATRLPGGGVEWSCDECGADLDGDDDACPTIHALGINDG